MWYTQNMQSTITSIKEKENFEKHNIIIDTLLLDLNGEFHNSAQKIFQYGNKAPHVRLIPSKNKTKKILNTSENIEKVYEDVCQRIENLVEVVNPTSKLLLFVDGPAPFSKQYQQRQRRFRPVEGECIFDSNCITPGTQFMHDLGIYIDNYIKKQKKNSKKWKSLFVLFSNEKVPGEGEHKAVQFVRKYGKNDETYCINGPDADLFMLAMATHKQNFYILREDTYNPNNKFFCIDISKTREIMYKKLKWESEDHRFVKNQGINDFIFMCFIVGNDFLPHIPSIEIIEEGIELMLSIYLQVAKLHGHLTNIDSKGNITINKNALFYFLEIISSYEKDNLEEKLNKKTSYFPDKLINKNSSKNENGWSINLNNYINDYNKKHFGETEKKMENVCNDYLHGLQWVLTYYSKGCPSWRWYYSYQYAPFASTLKKYVKDYKHKKYGSTKPCLPFHQLLNVLPPRSANLLPEPLNKILLENNNENFPTDPIVDLSGKRKEWEGIVIVPMADQKIINKFYKNNINIVDDEHKIKNILQNEKIYD